MFIVDQKRINTMRQRLGDASELVDDDAFLPMFRHRQIHHREEFEQSIKVAKTKKNASRYFATIWSRKNINASLGMLRKMINRAKNLVLEQYYKAKKRAEGVREKQGINAAGREKYLDMRDKFCSSNGYSKT